MRLIFKFFLCISKSWLHRQISFLQRRTTSYLGQRISIIWRNKPVASVFNKLILSINFINEFNCSNFKKSKHRNIDQNGGTIIKSILQIMVTNTFSKIDFIEMIHWYNTATFGITEIRNRWIFQYIDIIGVFRKVYFIDWSNSSNAFILLLK